jgi:uracil-DNA glycosylase
MQHCVACTELAATRTQVVVGVAPFLSTGTSMRTSSADVMLVGEAPGATEDATGMPFVGKAGMLLDQLLAEVGLPRSTVAVVNVLKCRPPGNRAPSKSEVANCRGWLSAQIAVVDPQVICALGGTAARWFFGDRAKISDLRGCAHQIDGRQVVSTSHPSAAIRFGPAGMPRAALREDLALVASLVAGGANRASGADRASGANRAGGADRASNADSASGADREDTVAP